MPNVPRPQKCAKPNHKYRIKFESAEQQKEKPQTNAK